MGLLKFTNDRYLRPSVAYLKPNGIGIQDFKLQLDPPAGPSRQVKDLKASVLEAAKPVPWKTRNASNASAGETVVFTTPEREELGLVPGKNLLVYKYEYQSAAAEYINLVLKDSQVSSRNASEAWFLKPSRSDSENSQYTKFLTSVSQRFLSRAKPKSLFEPEMVFRYFQAFRGDEVAAIENSYEAVLVVDCGAATCDFSVLLRPRSGGKFKPFSDFSTVEAGREIDRRVQGMIAAALETTPDSVPLELAEYVKVSVSRTNQPILVAGPDNRVARFSPEDLETVARPTFGACTEAITRVCRGLYERLSGDTKLAGDYESVMVAASRGREPTKIITKVLLAGGTSQLPGFAGVIRRALGSGTMVPVLSVGDIFPYVPILGALASASASVRQAGRPNEPVDLAGSSPEGDIYLSPSWTDIRQHGVNPHKLFGRSEVPVGGQTDVPAAELPRNWTGKKLRVAVTIGTADPPDGKFPVASDLGGAQRSASWQNFRPQSTTRILASRPAATGELKISAENSGPYSINFVVDPTQRKYLSSNAEKTTEPLVPGGAVDYIVVVDFGMSKTCVATVTPGEDVLDECRKLIAAGELTWQQGLPPHGWTIQVSVPLAEPPAAMIANAGATEHLGVGTVEDAILLPEREDASQAILVAKSSVELATPDAGSLLLPQASVTEAKQGAGAIPIAALPPHNTDSPVPRAGRPPTLSEVSYRESPTSEDALVETLVDSVAAGGLDIDRITLIHLYLCFKTSSLVLLAGPPGVGKSALAREFARSLGLHEANDNFARIAVEPNWTSWAHLAGPGRSFHGILTRKGQRPDDLHCIVLDECNLAQMDYYLAPALSAMEDDGVLELGPGVSVDARLQSPRHTTWLLGTMNVDEAGTALTDKVLDRAGLVDLRAPRQLPTQVRPVVDTGATTLQQPLSPALWQSWRDLPAMISVPPELQELVTLLGSVKQGQQFLPSFRVVRRISTAMHYATRLDGLSEGDHASLLDMQILTSLLPRLRGDGRSAPALQKLAEIAKDNNWMRSSEKVGVMLDAANGYHPFSYWSAL